MPPSRRESPAQDDGFFRFIACEELGLLYGRMLQRGRAKRSGARPTSSRISQGNQNTARVDF